MTDTTPSSIDQLLRHRAWMQALARALVRNHSEADDAAQEVWVRALERPPAQPAAARGWLRTVLRNVLTDRARGARRRTERETVVGSQSARRTTECPSDAVERADLHRRVVEAVFALSEDRRRVLLLRFYDDLPPRAIGRELGISAETARKRVQRALVALRQELDRRHGGRRESWSLALVSLSGASVVRSTSKGVAMAAKSKLTVGFLAAGLLLFLAVGVGFTLFGPGPSGDGEGASKGAVNAEETGVASTEASSAGHSGRAADDVDRARRRRGRRSRRREAGSREEPIANEEEPLAPRLGRKGVVAGAVRDASGKAVVGAAVTLTFGDQRAPRRTLTDASGGFELGDLPDGAFTVSVESPGRVAVQRVVRPGDEPLELALPDPTRLEGVVLNDVTSLPVAGLVVYVKLGSGGYVSHARTQTDAQGAFVFEALAPGLVRVQVGERFGATAGNSDYVEHETKPFELPSKRLEIRIQPGRVITGTIVDERGDPVRGVVKIGAFAVSEHGDTVADSRRQLESDGQGRFRLQGLLDHPYTLTFIPQASSGTETSDEASTEDGQEDPLAWAGATTLENVQPGSLDLIVRLARAGHIAGRLVDQDGEPVTRKKGDRRGWLQISSGRTGGLIWVDVQPDGTFRSPPLDVGRRYNVQVGAFPGYGLGSASDVIPGPDEVRIVLQRTHVIRGVVVDQDGKPAPSGVPVHAYAIGVKYEGQGGLISFGITDHKGRFEVSSIGPHTFQMVPGGGASSFVPGGPLQSVKHDTEDVILKVTKGVTFGGRLLDADGNGVLVPYLSVRSAAQPMAAATTAVKDADGRFVVHAAMKGKVTVMALIAGKSVELGEFEAPATDVEVRLPKQ